MLTLLAGARRLGCGVSRLPGTVNLDTTSVNVYLHDIKLATVIILQYILAKTCIKH